jgi:hypothetical protein
MSIFLNLLISFETNQPKTIHFSNIEIFIIHPIFYTLWILPFVLLVGLPATFVSASIKAKFRIKNKFINIAIYLIITCIVTPFLPAMINEIAATTSYKFWINPYYIIPVLGAIILGFLEGYIIKGKNN